MLRLAFVLAICLPTGFATSDPTARRLKQHGDAKFRAAAYDAAIDAYGKALHIEASPRLFYSVSRLWAFI